jgi:tRNA(fMet)-specific endonuclease VapC
VITHLLDTDICIYALKRRSVNLATKLKENDGRVAISDVTLFELYFGAESYENPGARFDLIESFAARLEVVAFDSKAARHAGQIRASMRRSGQMIGAYDILIAAIARANGLALATNNLREFSRVEGLLVEKWL